MKDWRKRLGPDLRHGPVMPAKAEVEKNADDIARSLGWINRHAMRAAVLRVLARPR